MAITPVWSQKRRRRHWFQPAMGPSRGDRPTAGFRVSTGASCARLLLAQELIQRILDLLFHAIRAAVAHVGVLEIGGHDVDPGLLGGFGIGQHAGIGLELRVLRPERQDARRARGHERHPQIVQRHHPAHHVRVLLGEEHRNVAAIGMADQRQMVVVGVRQRLLQFAEREEDVLHAAFVDAETADIERALLGHQRRVGRQIVLNAGDHDSRARRARWPGTNTRCSSRCCRG